MTALIRNNDSHPAVQLTKELMRRSSITPNDDGCQELLAVRLRPLGFAVEDFSRDGVSNTWAITEGNGPVFCFAGHTDVVPTGPTADWTSDPFVPTVRNGNLFGRGAADMKSGLAAMIVAAETFLTTYPRFEGRLAFLITSDEEGDAISGTRHVVKQLTARGQHINWCVIGEPSSQILLGDTVRIGRRGSLNGIITVTGIQGHAAFPQLADNPIHRFGPALAALCDKQWDNGNRDFPPSSLQVLDLQSGAGAANVIPGKLIARLNIRYSTQWHYKELQQEIEKLLNQYELNYKIEWQLSGEPFLTKPGILTEAVSTALTEITGQPPEQSTGGGTSDGRFISKMGTEVIELGPINKTIHKVDEFVRVEDIAALCAMYYRTMELIFNVKS